MVDNSQFLQQPFIKQRIKILKTWDMINFYG